MTTFERIKDLAKKQGKSLNRIEEELSWSRNTLYSLKVNKPSSERLETLADYFGVSVDYLLGRTDNPRLDTDRSLELTVEEALASVMGKDGKKLSDNDRAILTGIIEAYIEKSKKTE